MEIKKLILENIQPFKKAEINFSPGLNVIVGPTNSGKSAIMRAISFLFFSTPSPKSLLRFGEKEFRILLETSTAWIERIKNGENILVVNGQEFRAFGHNLPQEFFEALSIPEEFLEFVYASQFSPPFLLSLSDTQKGRVLSLLGSGVEVLDRALVNIQKDIRDVKAQHSLLEKERDEVRDTLAVFERIPEAEQFLESASAREERIKEMQQYREEILSLLHRSKSLSARLLQLQRRLEFLETVKEERLDHLNAAVVKHTKLLALLEKSRSCKDFLNLVEVYLEESFVDPDKVAKLEALSKKLFLLRTFVALRFKSRELKRKLEESFVDVSLLQSLESSLDKLMKLRRFLVLRKALDHFRRRDEKLVQEEQRLVQEAKEAFQGRCPTCLRPIDAEDLLAAGLSDEHFSDR